MQRRNYEMGQANNDLLNLLTSVNLPIVMLGHDLSIRRFTPKAEEVLGLNPTDVDRLLVHIKLKLEVPEFEHMAIQVMRDAPVSESFGRVRPGIACG
jgi:two-component system, chemotaxis family, CheB/CheR fusion protein